jgi:lantibiotic modifying enzyme
LAGPLARREKAVPCPRRRALLAWLGERLRAAQGPDGGWRAPDLSRPLAGLSHGASGIGLALIEIGVALGDETLIDAGAAGFAYEETIFDAATGNWRDLRPDVPAGPGMASWCHGAPGIGLARLRALQVAPDHRDAPQWRDALDRALRHTAAQPLGPHDFVCCGNLGRAWILRTAGAVLAASVWIAEADRITAATTARPGPPGFSHATGLPPLGFHVGLAGIGLAWLQHGRAAPDPIDALLL